MLDLGVPIDIANQVRNSDVTSWLRYDMNTSFLTFSLHLVRELGFTIILDSNSNYHDLSPFVAWSHGSDAGHLSW
jgi:hypothetical protein